MAVDYTTAAGLRAALAAKLQQSALTMDDAECMQLQIFQKAPTGLPLPLAGFKIPYFNFQNKKIEFYRFRYFPGQQNQNGFQALVKDQLKELRYAQLTGSGNHLYIPPIGDWETLQNNPGFPMVLTEGEIKAYCLVKHGFPSLGLGGVWNFKNKIRPLLEEFKEFVWKTRTVYILFDSDIITNPQVAAAANTLARELLLLGAIPYICYLPALHGSEKTGIDDFIAARGTKNLKKDILEGGVMFAQAEELFKLNEEVMYVEDPGLVIRSDTLQRLSPHSFVDHAYATRRFFQTVQQGKQTKLVERSAAAEWIKWELRTTVKQVTYAPGQPRILPTGELNTWRGWGCVPHRGSVQPFIELLHILFGDDKDIIRWAIQWFAYSIQNPGTKLYTALLLWSVKQGTGKSTLGYTMQRIYGLNFVEINNTTIHGSYTDWAVDKQFVMGDEVLSRDARRDAADRFKSLITQRQMRVNIKYVPSYVVPDCINYLFTSNHPDAFFLEDTDRRFFVHEVKADPPPTRWFSDYYIPWLDNEGGKEAIFYYLLHVDLTGFNPNAHAPMTSSKIEMQQANKSEMAAWVDQLVQAPDVVLRFGNAAIKRSIFTASELLRFFDPSGTNRFATVAQMGRELARAQVYRIRNGTPVRTKTSGVQRLWVVRDVNKLKLINDARLIDMFDKEREVGDDEGSNSNAADAKRPTKF